MDKFQGMNRFLSEKLRAPTMTAHDAPDGGDQQLADAAAALADETADYPYTPPMPVPVMEQIKRHEGMRGSASEVWLVNPPAALPGTGLLVGGGSAEKGSQFPINSIRVDNMTSQWLYWPENGVFVPPFWYGRVFRFTGSLVQRVRFETPTGISANTLASTQVARVIFSEDYWDEQSGSPLSASSAVAAAAILDGRQVFLATTAATTLITVPIGRTWVGTIGASCAAAVAGGVATQGEATAIFTISGAGATPAAGTVFGVHVLIGANVAAGTVGDGSSDVGSTPLTVIAGAVAALIQVASTNTGTSSVVDAWAVGQLL